MTGSRVESLAVFALAMMTAAPVVPAGKIGLTADMMQAFQDFPAPVIGLFSVAGGLILRIGSAFVIRAFKRPAWKQEAAPEQTR